MVMVACMLRNVSLFFSKKVLDLFVISSGLPGGLWIGGSYPPFMPVIPLYYPLAKSPAGCDRLQKKRPIVVKDAAGGLLSPLGPSPLCDYSVVSDNSLLLYIIERIMISSLRAHQDPHTRTPDTVSSNTF
jgi:hypothetical protein